MVHLDLASEQGGFLYFDVQRIEPVGSVFALTGTLGDGAAEAEVLVEVGEGVEITFVDEWLGGGDLRKLLEHSRREEIVQATAEAVQRMHFCVQGTPSEDGGARRQVTGYRFDGRAMPLRPREYGEQLELPLVAEACTVWGEAA